MRRNKNNVKTTDKYKPANDSNGEQYRKKYKDNPDVKSAKANVNYKKLLSKLESCIEAGLEFAEKVLRDESQVEIIKICGGGKNDNVKQMVPKYSPELKAHVLELIIGKYFPDKKDKEFDDDKDTPQVVGFNYTVISNT